MVSFKTKTNFNIYIKKLKKGLSVKDDPYLICKNIISGEYQIPEFMNSLSVDEFYYWIGNIYTSLIPQEIKKGLSAHFTPPQIAYYTIKRVEELGLDITTSRLVDPASGGAAFLTPISAACIDNMKEKGKSDAEIGLHISKSLYGIEIDQGLAGLSRLILNDYMAKYLSGYSNDFSKNILNADSLKVRNFSNKFDAVISNPPYGKINNPSADILERFSDSITNKHVNKYALFIALAIDWVRPGGLISLVVPTSFISGPSFGNIRKFILDHSIILEIDLIDKRNGLFVDVLQDACIVFLQKKNGPEVTKSPGCRFLKEDGTWKNLGFIDIPSTPSIRPWVLPSELSPYITTGDFFTTAYSKLADYGYGVRAGYFVWNRQKERSREGNHPESNEFPLVWAHCVKANVPCRLSTHRNLGQPELMSFVKFDYPSESLISQPAIVLQRTTNRRQTRRLVAGYIPESLIDKYGSLITENHTIVVYPLPDVEQKISYKTMCRLLNSKPVDNRYRQISGTVNVSVKLLKEMPFPPHMLVQNRLRDDLTAEQLDELVENCYREAAKLDR